MFKILVLSNLLLMLSADDNGLSRVVNIESGKVRGYKDADYEIFAFYGIPYATAPTGTYKFKAPRPAPKWTDVFEAIDEHIVCPQTQIFKGSGFNNESVREDCLIANIYVPNTTKDNIPVLIDIHGGSFQIGYGNMFTLKKLVDTKKVIVVNFNYRLGVYGFLCLGTIDVPGNAGMKDIVALLRWVKRNIAAFGGNPNEITISEYSSGASIVDFLILSPSAKGLFHKAIPESGPNLALFSMQPYPLETAKQYAKASNFKHVNDIYALENFYKTSSFASLAKEDFKADTDPTMQFAPCIERYLGEEAFLLESPFDILNKGKYAKVPILCGFTNMKEITKLEHFHYWKTKMNENFSEFLPVDFQFHDEVEKQTVSKVAKEFYFGKEPINYDNSSVQAFKDYFTDIFFIYGTMRSVRLQVEAGNNQMYLYEYSFVDDDEAQEQYHLNVHLQGQGALLYESKDIGTSENKTESEKFKRARKTVMELWLNFITERMPVPIGSWLPEWPPANAEGSPHMSIGEYLELRGPSKKRMHRMNFWHDLYDRHYRNPLPPMGIASRLEL